jgi:hypothetical protein
VLAGDEDVAKNHKSYQKSDMKVVHVKEVPPGIAVEANTESRGTKKAEEEAEAEAAVAQEARHMPSSPGSLEKGKWLFGSFDAGAVENSGSGGSSDSTPGCGSGRGALGAPRLGSVSYRKYDSNINDSFDMVSENSFKMGTTVQVIKEGSSKFGTRAKVVNPDWNGMVKVVLAGDPQSSHRSYKPADLEIVVLTSEEAQEELAMTLEMHDAELAEIRIALMSERASRSEAEAMYVALYNFMEEHHDHLKNHERTVASKNHSHSFMEKHLSHRGHKKSGGGKIFKKLTNALRIKTLSKASREGGDKAAAFGFKAGDHSGHRRSYHGGHHHIHLPHIHLPHLHIGHSSNGGGGDADGDGANKEEGHHHHFPHFHSLHFHAAHFGRAKQDRSSGTESGSLTAEASPSGSMDKIPESESEVSRSSSSSSVGGGVPTASSEGGNDDRDAEGLGGSGLGGVVLAGSASDFECEGNGDLGSGDRQMRTISVQPRDNSTATSPRPNSSTGGTAGI